MTLVIRHVTQDTCVLTRIVHLMYWQLLMPCLLQQGNLQSQTLVKMNFYNTASIKISVYVLLDHSLPHNRIAHQDITVHLDLPLLNHVQWVLSLLVLMHRPSVTVSLVQAENTVYMPDQMERRPKTYVLLDTTVQRNLTMTIHMHGIVQQAIIVQRDHQR